MSHGTSTRLAFVARIMGLVALSCAPTVDTASSGPEALANPRPMGTIVASSPVGTLPGGISVGADGSGHYTVPLEVPPGRLGMQPGIALEYSSNADNGLLGVGWSISGFSSINRCGKTWARDQMSRRTNLDSLDNYCLDGAPLVLVPGSTTEYRTDPDTQARVIVDTWDTYGPLTWSVWTSDERHAFYGTTTDSIVDATGTDGRPHLRAAWLSSRIEDVSSNYMTFKYATTTNGTLTNGRTVELKPLEIDYTGCCSSSDLLPANRSVVFRYDAGELGRDQPTFH